MDAIENGCIGGLKAWFEHLPMRASGDVDGGPKKYYPPP